MENGNNDSLYGGFKVLGQGDEINLNQEEVKPEGEAVKTETPAVEDNSSLTKPDSEVKVETPEKTEVAADVTTSNEPTTEKVTTEKVEEFEELKAKDLYAELDACVKEEYGFESFNHAVDYVNINWTNHDENDPSHVGEWDTIVAAMRLDDPKITDAEIEGKMYEFNVLFDDEAANNLSEAEYITLNAKFQEMLRKSEEKLTEDQKTIDLDSIVVKYPKQNQPVTQESNVVDKQTAQKALEQILSSQLTSGSEKVFSIKDLDGKEIASVKFTPNDADRTRAIENGKMGYERWVNQDGSFNEVKYANEMFVLENLDRIMAAVYGSAKAVGSEAAIKDINNIDFSENRKTPPSGEKPKSLGAQLGWV